MLIISDSQYSLIVLKLHCFCTVFLCCVFVFPWYFAYVLHLLIHLHSIPVLFSETVFSLPSVMSHNTQYSSAVCPETVVNFVSVVCLTVYQNHIPVLFLKQSFCFCAVPQHNTYIAFLCCVSWNIDTLCSSAVSQDNHFTTASSSQSEEFDDEHQTCVIQYIVFPPHSKTSRDR